MSPRFMIRIALLAVISLLAPLASLTIQAQEVIAPETSVKEILETQEKTAELIAERAESDPKGLENPRTPLATALAISAALKRGDYTRASDYLDMRYLPEELDQYEAEDLVRALALVWGLQNVIDLDDLSDEEEGNLDDGLPRYRDQVGTIVTSTSEVPIYLQRVPDGDGGRVWKFSNATVAQIPALWEELGPPPAAIYLGTLLPDVRIMGMENWQWFSTILFFVFAWPLAALVSNILMRLALLIPNRFPLGIQRFFRLPARFFLFVLIARLLMEQMGLSLRARIYFDSSGVDYIAYTVLFLGALSLIRDYQIRKMERLGNAHYVALLKPFTTIVKVLVVTIIALVWADRAGYNMSTIIAGLGVGSLAVALAAQKTLENVIGAITLYTARPVSPGDLCRFGNVVGVVEEIGLRSTQIRTINRTLLVVPNSVFSSVEVENLSSRDRIRYFRNLQLQMTTADQLRLILGNLRKLFLAHPMVLQETVSVRLENIESATAMIRIDSGIDTTDYQEYLAVAEDLNLHIVELVHNAGAIFSGAGQVLQLRDFYQASEGKLAEVETILSDWRDQDEFPFPDIADDQKLALKGTLDYPPGGKTR
ncbi:MAG: mechanosensitive ion channel domain-containing protein [Halioglobus sp.]